MGTYRHPTTHAQAPHLAHHVSRYRLELASQDLRQGLPPVPRLLPPGRPRPQVRHRLLQTVLPRARPPHRLQEAEVNPAPSSSARCYGRTRGIRRQTRRVRDSRCGIRDKTAGRKRHDMEPPCSSIVAPLSLLFDCRFVSTPRPTSTPKLPHILISPFVALRVYGRLLRNA